MCFQVKFVGFSLPFLYIGDECVFVVNTFITNSMYINVLPSVSYVYIQCGFICNAVWRFSNNFSSSFRGRNLALNRIKSYIIGVNTTAFWGRFDYTDYKHPRKCLGSLAPMGCWPPKGKSALMVTTPQGHMGHWCCTTL